MLQFPHFDPVILSIGAFDIRWYGLCYLLGFLGAYALMIKRRDIPVIPFEKMAIADLLIYVALGVIFGGTLGYWLLYQPEVLLTRPWQALAFWLPGRSFHGGLLGVLLAVLLFTRHNHYRFLDVTDFIAPVVPVGLFFGRLGNFINGELWGRVTTVPWGMVFSEAGFLPRHPSQLYEAALEGILLGIILLYYARKPRSLGKVSAVFLMGYASFRFVVEYFREPDWYQGFVAYPWLTMGQLLSVPMLIFGAWLFYHAHQRSLRTCVSITT